MRGLIAAALAVGVLATGGAVRADEVDDLVERLGPPARFADHRPDWSWTKHTFTFQHYGRETHEPFWLVRDGERHVAVIPLTGFHSGTIYVQDFRPLDAPTELDFPTERWHIDTSVGSELRTNNFIPGEFGATDESYRFTKRKDGTLVLRRAYQGRTTFNRWAHRTKSPVDVDAVNTIVFRVDPRLGYVVEATYDIWTAPPPSRYEFASAATSGRYGLWPGDATCYRIAITPPGEDGYVGYATNHGATKQHGGDMRCRDGGFVAFLNDETGWSPTTTLAGADARLVVCGAHTDHDFVVPWPKDAKVRNDGLQHFVVTHRLLALPPELTRHVWDRMELLHRGERKLMVRFGVLEDFEAQPLPLDGRYRGMLWNAEVTTAEARSGEKAIVFEGRSGHGDPQIALEPNQHYRIEAWMKVEALSAAELGAAEKEAREGLQKRRAGLRKRIEREKDEAKRARFEKELAHLPTTFPGLETPEACLSGWFYEWSPHVDEPIGPVMKSNVLKPGGGWQQVRLDFTTPKWGPFIQLTFHATNCRAYLDDFRFAIVGDADGAETAGAE